MSRPTILWIHGYPLSSRIFEPQRAIAGAEHVMPDLPGFGSAPPPASGDWAIDDYARHALAATGERRVIVAGLSMGGYVAFAAARLAPERVAGLILLDTRETADSDEARQGRYKAINQVQREGVRPIVESMLPKMLTAAAPDVMKSAVREIMMSSSPEGVMAALRAMAARADSSPLLPRLPRALVIVGEEDAITPPSDSARMAAAIPDACLVTIAGAAHLANYERADEVNAAVEAWLGDYSLS